MYNLNRQKKIIRINEMKKLNTGSREYKVLKRYWKIPMCFRKSIKSLKKLRKYVLNSLKSLSQSGDSWPNYVRLEWEADDEGIRYPPTTHLIADNPQV